MRPSRQLAVPYVVRGLQLWLGVRLLASAVIGLAGGEALHPGTLSSALIVVVCVAAGFADIRRRHEQALLANLAVTPAITALFFAAPAALGEAVIRVLA